MKPHSLAFALSALCALSLTSVVVSQDPTPSRPQTFSHVPPNMPEPGHGLPGQKAGTEQWIVHFEKRSFDLLEFRKAMYARRPWEQVKPILDGIEARMRNDQAPFSAAVEKLGGRVSIQYWIVNAAAVEIPFAKVGDLRKLPNVSRVYPNLPVMPAIKVSTAVANHNSDTVNASGYKGKGIAAAIVDTGLDSNCGTKGRPHQTYYEDGNLSKRNRLVANLAVGSQPADNSHPHGTGVSGIAAGGNWGTSGADNGHAPHADIVGISISNSSSGGSSYATQAAGWQEVAKQAAKYGIKTANMSYHGAPSPLDVSQQALDSTALNADVMICVAAGNTSSTTTSSISCANGLAVAAIAPGTHAVASFSSRGPLSSDSQRFYPDIAACGVNTVMPLHDSTTSNYTGSGTSMASPQVTGAATLLRAQVPALKADETKAILLASALDISQQNTQAPYNTRNAFGMGMLKDDAAMTLAMNSAGHGRATVDSTNKTWSKTVLVTKGKTYRAAISFMRQTMTSTAWSNLDIDILNGTTVIANAKTPRNLYEVAIFRATATAALTLRVNGVSIENGKQEFAWAFTEGSGPPLPADYSLFGQGCPSTSQGCTLCEQRNWAAKLAARTTTAQKIAILGYGYPQLNICGIDLYASARSAAVDVTVVIQEYDNQTSRPGKVLASGKVKIGTAAGLYHAKLGSTVAMNSGGVFFVTFDNADKLNLPVAPAGTVLPHSEFNGLVWSSLSVDTIWQYRIHCDRGMRPPKLTASGKPVLGKSFSVDLSEAPASASAIFMTGLSKSKWGSVNLPLTYAAPCNLYVSPDVVTMLTTSTLGAASMKFNVPNQSNLVGIVFFNQYMVSNAVNPIGVIATNAGQGKVGEF